MVSFSYFPAGFKRCL